MKKILNILLVPVMAAMLFACNYNEDNFPGLDEMTEIKNVAHYEHAITSADITTIVNALNAKKTAADSAMAKTLNADKAFSSAAPSQQLIPYALKNLYKAASISSSAKVAFPYKDATPEYLTKLSQPIYTLTNDDYKLVWGSNYVPALTPAKSPSTQLPMILATRFPTAVNGDYKNVDYNYSLEEPIVDVVEVEYLKADFEGTPNGATVPVSLPGWLNVDLGGSLFWAVRAFSGNQYAQISANNSGVQNNVWLVSSQADFTSAINPQMTFNVTEGYFNGRCLNIYISSNFNGTQAGISAASWTEITSNFNIPDGPASGYGTLATAGTMSLAAYVGKKVNVAFVYKGNGEGNVLTTTYQLDNIKISEVKTATTVKASEKQYAVYQLNNNVWAPVDNTVAIIQPADYTKMGVTSLSTTTAPGYIPAYLTGKYPYAQEGNVKAVVYRTTANGSAMKADEYVFTAGRWEPVALIEAKTEQYVFSGYDQQGWIFDPTIVLTLKRVTGNEPNLFKTVTYIKDHMQDKWFPKLTYVNEEHYYGLNSYYAQIIYGNDRVLYGDDAIKALKDNDVKRYALFDERVAEIMPIFAQLNYPLMKSTVSGVKQLLKVRITRYYSSSKLEYIEMTLECTTSGTVDAPAQFKFIGIEVIPSL